jgi:GNAT superfamily N-acetyltransferase
MNWQLRVIAGADISAAVALKDLAGWNQTALDWERFLAACPQGCFVAESGGRIIGTSATISYGGQLAWIGMVIVAAEHRGQSIGTALLRKAIYLSRFKEHSLHEAEYDIERWMLTRTVSQPTEGRFWARNSDS